MVTLTLIQKIGTEPIVLHLRFVTIASIIFENANADVDAKDPFTRYDLLCVRQLFFNMLFCEIVHTVRWLWIRFAMYLYWNRTSQSHRIGMEPIHV